MAQCPACGVDYSAHTTVQSGDQFGDHLPSPPYTFFKQYARVCVDPEDYEHAAGGSSYPVGVYFHTLDDMALDADGFNLGAQAPDPP